MSTLKAKTDAPHPLLSLEDFAAWLDEQPFWRFYNYMNIDRCACAQYADAHGISRHAAIQSPLDTIACSITPWGQTFGMLRWRVKRRLFLRRTWFALARARGESHE